LTSHSFTLSSATLFHRQSFQFILQANSVHFILQAICSSAFNYLHVITLTIHIFEILTQYQFIDILFILSSLSHVPVTLITVQFEMVVDCYRSLLLDWLCLPDMPIWIL